MIHLDLRMHFLPSHHITPHSITCIQRGPRLPTPFPLANIYIQIAESIVISIEHSTEPSIRQEAYRLRGCAAKECTLPVPCARLICRNAGGMSLAICISCHLLAVVGSRDATGLISHPILFLAFNPYLIIALQRVCSVVTF